MKYIEKLYYVANVRIPTEKAHGIQIMKTCEALARQGIDVTLVIPNRSNTIKEDPFSYFKTEKIFDIQYLPTIDIIPFGIPGSFILETFSFTISLLPFFFRKTKRQIIYTRGEMGFILPFFSKIQYLFWEAHTVPGHPFLYRRLFKFASGIVSITDCLARELQDLGVSREKMIVSPDGVDFKQFSIKESKKSARRKLSLPLDKKLVMYVGSNISWKGTETLIEASYFLPSSVEVLMVGSEGQNLDKLSYFGEQPYEKIPLWLQAADVLVLTGTKKEKISSCYTSPLKLFEYMASGRPIVASRLPSFMEILNNQNSILVDPENAKTLSEGIKFLLEDFSKAKSLGEKAKEDAKNYDWETRALKIKNFLELQTRKKVLFMIPRLVQRGSEHVVVSEINNLNKDLFQSYLCTLAPELKPSLMKKVDLKDKQKYMVNFRSRHDICSWLKLITWLRKERFDIIYTYLFPANFIGRIAGRIAGVSSIIISERSAYTNRSSKARLVNFILEVFTTCLVANSNSVKKYLVEKEKISPEKIQVIYNGVDLKKFQFNKKKRMNYRKKFGLTPNAVAVISVGSVVSVKGIDILINTAYELIEKNKKDIHFYIVGMDDSDFANSLKIRAKELKISPFIHFLGPRDDIPDLLNMADIFFMPSRREGFPNALLEAMAVKLPPVASDLDSLQEVLNKGRYGLIGSSVNEFVYHLDKLSSDASMRHHYGLLARERAEDFSLNSHIKNVENLFLE